MPLGVQIQKKARIENGIRKPESIQRKSRNVEGLQGRKACGGRPTLRIRLERRGEGRGGQVETSPQGKEKHTQEVPPWVIGRPGKNKKTITGNFYFPKWTPA